MDWVLYPLSFNFFINQTHFSNVLLAFLEMPCFTLFLTLSFLQVDFYIDFLHGRVGFIPRSPGIAIGIHITYRNIEIT